MDPDIEWRASDTFVVRVFRDTTGAMRGLVHHVRSGEQESFDGIERLAAVLRRLATPPTDPSRERR